MIDTYGKCVECTDNDIHTECYELWSVNGSNHILCTSHAAELPESYTYTMVTTRVAEILIHS